MGQNSPFRRISCIFIIAGLEPKLLVFMSSHQKQILKALKVDQFYQQEQTSICLSSNVTNRTIIAFQRVPKWQKAAKSGFCKFGSFQPCPTHRQLDWNTMMFIESPFLWHPTCLLLHFFPCLVTYQKQTLDVLLKSMVLIINQLWMQCHKIPHIPDPI